MVTCVLVEVSEGWCGLGYKCRRSGHWPSKYNNQNGLVGREGRLEGEEEGLRTEPQVDPPFHSQM